MGNFALMRIQGKGRDGKDIHFVRPPAHSSLGFLNAKQTAQLTQWLLTKNIRYDDIVELMWTNFKIKTNTTAVSKYYSENVVQHVLAMRERAVEMATGYANAIRLPVQFSSAAMDALEAKAMQASFDPSTTPKDLKILLDLMLRWQEQKIRAEQLRFNLRRMDMLERKQAKLLEVMESKLTPEEVAERCRAIFKQNGTITPEELGLRATGRKKITAEVRNGERLPIGSASSVSVPLDERSVQI